MGRFTILALLVVTVLVPQIAEAAPKRKAGCPAQAPEPGTACSRKADDCRYRCEGEGHRDRLCSCAKDDAGKLRWQCDDIGAVCVM